MTFRHRRYVEQATKESLMLQRIVIFALTLSLASCASLLKSLDRPGPGLSSERVSVEWPQRWRTFRPFPADKNAAAEGLWFSATRDGFGLQLIRLLQRPLDSNFTHTKKKLASGMPPQEAAEIVVDDFRANPNIADLTLIETSSATLAGSEGFRITFGYKDKSGLRRQSVVYGSIDKELLTMLSFDAPQRHYFALDLATFEQVKESLRWL